MLKRFCRLPEKDGNLSGEDARGKGAAGWTAVPAGLVLGVVTTWGLCAVLRFLVGEEFSDIPLFGVSIIGIACGILVGVITVLIAANAPAKRASRVSPVAAVSGNTGSGKVICLALFRKWTA